MRNIIVIILSSFLLLSLIDCQIEDDVKAQDEGYEFVLTSEWSK